ncbi:MAG: enoyl-CoA hydratase [Gammaproteobacteria bacterium]|nr:enoyl-CoA hydratase [Gammaproteobacteria bacterium]
MSAAVQDPSSQKFVLYESNAGIAKITLNRPAQYNALSGEVLTALQEALDHIAADDTARVVIIAARGKAFSAGHDLKELRSSEDQDFHQRLFDRCGGIMQTIHQLPQPVIAQVQGIATAAGCQLVAACDLAIAADCARFAVSGIKVGLFCSTPAVPLSRNVSSKQAMHMLLTGDFISAEQALQYGLVNSVVSLENLESSVTGLAEKIATKSAPAIKTGKAMFYQQLGMELSAAYEFASETMACNLNSGDAREGIDAFIEKRPKASG